MATITAETFPYADTLLDSYPLPDELRAKARVGLAELLQALRDQTDLNANGRARALGSIHDDLRRLKAISDDRARFPGIADVEIRQPMFILGLPRCGTSLLHALIDGDPQVRTPLMWEVADPSPPPDAATFDNDPRIAGFNAHIERELGAPIDEIAKAHPIGAKIPQECGSFMTTSFRSSNPVMMNRIPGFYRWFLGADLTFRYEVHKMWLQHLGWRNPRKHWALKIQEHMYSLSELRTIYPDAIFVQPHRDPTTVIASISQLIRVIRTPAFDEQDPVALGHEMLHLWNDGQARMMSYRRAHPELPIHDMSYRALVRDPVASVRGVYQRFGWEFTPAAEAGLLTWLAENPAGKHGTHRYALEDFGLTESDVRDVYADYIETYGEYF
jgi:hypothetical protein